ncbi:hypothetical protein [Intrasporangium sp. YIM S08009]|uniref:hypothetical protein n=1 Tax=Intrasporangium zincisolvens TaxID=3080018 RepID=UPI002B051EB3|nr:hypothetical protein [Intrasporangium sp. YIM S08009]
MESWPTWLLVLVIDAIVVGGYVSVATPSRMYRGRFRFAQLPDRGYFGGLCAGLGFTPVGLWMSIGGSDEGVVANILFSWLVLCLAYCAIGQFAAVPIPKWFVPSAFKNDTEHVYPRRVLGLRKVDRLSDRPDAVARELLP